MDAGHNLERTVIATSLGGIFVIAAAMTLAAAFQDSIRDRSNREDARLPAIETATTAGVTRAATAGARGVASAAGAGF